jgi:hypothetical protein
MAGRFMKVKRIVIPFITLVIMTSQLAGCATMNSDEMLKSMNESPDVSIEYAIPDEEQQSLDATHVIGSDGKQIIVDTQDNLDIGLIDSDEDQVTELTHEELIEIFELAYDSKSALAGEIPIDALIKQELHIMPYFVAPNKQLPEDYEDQYRAWRPVETQEPEQQQSQTQQSSQTSKPNSGGQQQSSKPNTNTNGGTTSSTVEVDDSSIGISSGSILSDPSKLTEGIDPNQNPWDVQGKIFYGGG